MAWENPFYWIIKPFLKPSTAIVGILLISAWVYFRVIKRNDGKGGGNGNYSYN